MTKETFFTQVEECYQQQETMEFLPVIIRNIDGSYTEHSYMISRVVRPIDSATIEREAEARLAQGYEVDADVLTSIKIQEAQRLADEEAARLAKIEADRLHQEATVQMIADAVSLEEAQALEAQRLADEENARRAEEEAMRLATNAE